MNGLCDTYCYGCRFYEKSLKCCDYWEIIGTLRGCDPGKGCIHKERRKREKTGIKLQPKPILESRKGKSGPISQEENEKRMELYLLTEKSAKPAVSIRQLRNLKSNDRPKELLYSVWDNSGRLLACMLPAEECERIMRIGTGGLVTARYRERHGISNKWHIEMYVDGERK